MLPIAASSPWPVQVAAAVPLTLVVVRNVTGPGTLGDALIAVAALDRATTGKISFTLSGAGIAHVVWWAALALRLSVLGTRVCGSSPLRAARSQGEGGGGGVVRSGRLMRTRRCMALVLAMLAVGLRRRLRVLCGKRSFMQAHRWGHGGDRHTTPGCLRRPVFSICVRGEL